MSVVELDDVRSLFDQANRRAIVEQVIGRARVPVGIELLFYGGKLLRREAAAN